MTDRAARIAAALELLSVMDGGAAPAPERLTGLTMDEAAAAAGLYGQGLDLDREERRLRVVRMAYLVKHAPGAPTLEAAIEHLTDQQLDEFNHLTAEDL